MGKEGFISCPSLNYIDEHAIALPILRFEYLIC